MRFGARRRGSCGIRRRHGGSRFGRSSLRFDARRGLGPSRVRGLAEFDVGGGFAGLGRMSFPTSLGRVRGCLFIKFQQTKIRGHVRGRRISKKRLAGFSEAYPSRDAAITTVRAAIVVLVIVVVRVLVVTRVLGLGLELIRHKPRPIHHKS